MADRHDYVALEWVKGEIGETLKLARQALEAFVENPHEPSSMATCLDFVHQVHGTLQMVEFYGAALLAEEMENLTRALQQGHVNSQSEALEVLMQAILQMPVYLDRVQSARRDLPLVVLPLLNDLRSARGEGLLSETNLFSPPMNPVEPLDAAALARIDHPGQPLLLRKMRQVLQTALVGLLRDRDMGTNLNYLGRVFTRLEMVCGEAPLASLWQICAALVEGMAAGSIPNSPALRSLLRDTDKEFKRLLDNGVKAVNQPAPAELLKSLLFYIAKSSADTPRMTVIKERYRLAEALPDSALVDEERAHLAGPDREAMRSVIAALCEELVRVKDNLDLFVRSDRQQVSELELLLAPLKQIADTLAVLGFGLPRKVILDQLQTVQGLAAGQREPDDLVLMDVAGALLYVEATLAGMVGSSDSGHNEDSHLPTTDLTQIHQVVIRESRLGLQQAKDSIIEFIDSQWDYQHLERAPALLTQVRGGLGMIPLTRATNLLEGCIRFIQEQLLVDRTPPKWHQLDTLADVITGIEYYLERLAEDPTGSGQQILDVSTRSLEKLGYSDQSAVAEPVAEAEALSLAEPQFELDALVADFEAPEAQADELGFELESSDSADTFELDESQESPYSSSFELEDTFESREEQVEFEFPETVDEPDLVEEPAAQSLEEVEFFLSEEPVESESQDQAAAAEVPSVVPQVTAPATTLSDVMAKPVSEINPPAKNIPASLLPPPLDEEPVDDELREVFIEEAEEVLETINTHLPTWFGDLDNHAALTELRRAFHTLKGSGRMVRALVIGELAWAVENLLNRVLERTVSADANVRALVRNVVATLPELIGEFAAADQRQHDSVDLLAAQAHALARGEVFDTTPAESHVEAVVEEVDAFALDDASLAEFNLALEGDLSVEDEPAAVEEVSTVGQALGGDVDGIDPQLLEIFRNEAETHFESLQAFNSRCADQLPQPVTDDLQRALHTLKGSAYMAGIMPVAELATPLEKLLKEFKANLIPVDLLEAELLSEATKLFRIGLDQLETHPLQAIPGAAELIERIQQLQTERLDAALLSRRESEGAKRDPQVIANFLATGMDILFDAEGLLRNWQTHGGIGQELTALLDELTTLGRGAQLAALPQVDELCEALLDVYGAVEEGSLASSERFFNEAHVAHEALISMLDQLAAGLDVSPQTERVEALRTLLDDALDPRAVGLLQFGEDGSFTVTELAETSQTDESLSTGPAPVSEVDSTASDVAADDEQPYDLPAEFVPIEELTPTVASEPVPAAPVEPTTHDLDDEIVAIFLEEGVDILESAGQALQRWLDEPDGTSPLLALQRDLHTLKGGARMAEIRPIGDLAHELETLYEGLVDHRYNHTPELADLLLRSHDQLSVLLEQLQTQQPLSNPATLIDSIRTFRHAAGQTLSGETSLDIAAASPIKPSFKPSSEMYGDQELDEIDEPLFTEEFLAEIEADEPLSEAEPLDVLPAVEEFEATPEFDLSAADEAVTSEPTTAEPAAPELEEAAELASESEEAKAHTDDAEEDAKHVDELAEADAFDASDLDFDEPVTEESVDVEAAETPAVETEQGAAADAAAVDTVAANVAAAAATPAEIAANANYDDNERDPELLEIFLEEGFDIMESSGAALHRWQSEPGNTIEVETLLRDLHTLKGGARMVEVAEVGDLAHELEFLYEAFSTDALQPTEQLFGLLHSSQDLLAEMLEELRADRQPPSGNVLIAAIKHATGRPYDPADLPVAAMQEPVAEEAEQAVEPTPEPVVEAPLPLTDAPLLAAFQGSTQGPAEQVVLPFVQRAAQAAAAAAAQKPPQEQVKVPADLLENLVNLAGETSIFRGRIEQQVSDTKTALSEMESTIERMRDQLRRLDTETQAQILSGHQRDTERGGDYGDFDPLEMDRHSQLQQLSRALFESASDLLDIKETLAGRNRDAETLLLQQARVNTELQEGLMRTRMVPFDRMLPRLRRIVRQVSTELGKQTEFLVGNADGEMDRSVLERIVPPLEHMLRNAVDHGLESAEVRRAAGKPAKGTIRLNLSREGGDIVIDLSDDGAGVSLEAVRRKAIERGMMLADNELSEQEILQFILEAGFSTADKVTQISGRGVGMDVVLSEVKQLGGSMTIDSKAGLGTHFQIRLPFTVSVNRALMVMSGEDLYAIPLNTIEGIVRVSPYELEDFYKPDAPRYEYAGQDYELRYLGELLSNGQHPKLIGQSLPLPVILVRSNEHSVAVQVDALAGSREIVVKGLGPQFASVPGISGATILGDGRVVVILDLLAHLRGLQTRALNAQHQEEVARQGLQEIEPAKSLLVMVVDDSVTVRKVTTRLLERAGMNVITAKDGVDAIALLQEHTPDILLLDIEMPRMDGFEVATLIRHDAHLKHLPIIMITSRTGSKHRERAMAIGVNDYLGKPYQESLLIESIEKLAKPNE